ncbi:MAG: hypothetical protein B6226_00440 [Candidatus Cloacimonetes bacterium 4572_65]|nr:MAG: hypothetical protein B6226_00440 [Candidatus Cloacimonetes bacterium 4572_65]
MADKYNELNPEQLRAVKTTDGPVLVLAGAGSGKTRTIIYRTAYLINEANVDPFNILIVTFTNKAASELRDRLFSYFSINPSHLWVGTFHSICLRLLRAEYTYTPFNSNFTIYDADDQKALLKKVYKKLDIDKDNFPLQAVRSLISKRKNEFLLPEDIQYLKDEGFYNRNFIKIYTEYQKQLVANNSVDFDDIMLYTLKLLKENKAILGKYQEIFKYVMIDEYQDTNIIQYKLTSLLSKPENNICVVGDDDQAIYSWRGAEIKNILDFDKLNKKTTTIRLEQNYRSSKEILGLANVLIRNNTTRHPKELRSDIESIHTPVLKTLDSETSEAQYVVERIQGIGSEYNLKLNDFAVLYRTNSQSRQIETALIAQNLPYTIVGGVNFYQRREIKDIIAYLKVIMNPDDNEGLHRIINTPVRGIGKTTINSITNFAINREISFDEAILRVSENDSLSKRAVKSVSKFSSMLKEWREKSKFINCFELVNKVITDINYLEKLEKSSDPKLNSQAENIKEFIASTSQFREEFLQDNDTEPYVEDFLNSVSLLTDLDRFDRDTDSVNLLTIHNAKGLEFKAVFVVGIEEGLLPHNRSLAEEKDIEEERRLLYVAITRAKDFLFLTHAKYRRLFAFTEASLPSRFLREIGVNTSYKSSQIETPPNPKRKRKVAFKVAKPVEKEYQPGEMIFHERYGKGMVISSNGAGDSKVLTISFTTGLLKKINVKYVEPV